MLALIMTAGRLSANSQAAGTASNTGRKLFRLDGGDVTYAMGANARGELQTVYWGRRLATSDPLPTHVPVTYADEINDTEQEFPGWGGGVLDEPALKIMYADGNRIGVKRFVRDDGWFGQRKNDRAGLGDWYVNLQKFPHGLESLIAKVHSLEMDFGLWVEPEMVNPDSDLYRRHPDWVINFRSRPRTEERNQLVLNLARPEVREYVYSVANRLLSENQIAFLKWDLNRPWAEPGRPEVASDEEKEIYVIYTCNYYSILAELRQKHPGVEIESCSGGGRVDLGVLHCVDEVWTSDNTDPFDRLSIQDGFADAYTPGVMMAWMTDSPNWVNHRGTSLPYRFLSSMEGSLGIGANLNKWTSEDFTTAKEMIVAYKPIRGVVQHGLLYRLISPQSNGELATTESVAPERSLAVVFEFLHSQQMRYPAPMVFPEGLNQSATYTVRPLYGHLTGNASAKASGAFWMGRGINADLQSDYDAAAFVFERSKQ